VSLTLPETWSYCCPNHFPPPMSNANEWCTKKQVSKVIDRTERTVSRIIRDAIDTRTDDILSNVKLVYANGKEILGSDVTRDLVGRNEEEGSRTRWFFRTSWWREVYAVRINAETDPDSEAGGNAEGGDAGPTRRGAGPSATPGAPPPLPSDPTIRAVVLEHLHHNDQKHAAELRELTTRVLQVVETNQQLQGQTNTLFNQFQDAMSVGGGLRALVENTSKPPASQDPVAPPDLPDLTEAIVVDAKPQTPASKRERSKSATSPSAGKKPAKGLKKEGTDRSDISFAQRHLPTLSKLFTRRSK
jgi:hypothetical protein